MQKLIAALIAIGLTTLTGCEDAETVAIAKAQKCLDGATTAGAATTCRTMMAGYESPKAYGIVCAARFIEGGLTNAKLSSAIGKMLDNQGTADPAMLLMAYLAFPTSGQATDALTDCQKSLSKGYIFFASAAKLGTVIATAAGGAEGTAILNGTATEAQIATAAANAVATADPTTVGSTALVLYSAQCSSINSSNANVCSQIQSAINSSGGNTTTLGNTILNCLSTPNSSC